MSSSPVVKDKRERMIHVEDVPHCPVVPGMKKSSRIIRKGVAQGSRETTLGVDKGTA